MSKPTILTSLLLLMAMTWAGFAFAEELHGAEAANALCETASFEPARSEAMLLSTPLVQSRQRHEYVVQRLHRLMQVYSVLLQPSEYRFLPSDPDVMTVDTLEPLPIFSGSHALDLGSAASLSFPVFEGQLDELVAGYRSDQVLLRLHFQLAALENPLETYCETGADGVVVLHGRLLAGELVDRGESSVLARAENERLRTHRIRFGVDVRVSVSSPPEPRVTVISTTVTEGHGAPAEVEYLTLESESVLLPCYLRALNNNGRLRGALVTQYQVDHEGNLIHPTVAIDAIGDPLVTGCASAALQTIAVPRGSPRIPYGVRMTVIFSLVPQ